MKKILLVLSALFLVGIIFLVIRGNNIQEIKTEIEISAPPSKVWSVLMDVNAWHEWSPIINFSEGKPIVGSRLSIIMVGKEKGEDGPKYNPVILELKEQDRFHWRANMLAGFIFTNDKIFKLKETETGTHLIHIETFRGLMAPLMSGAVEENVPTMLDSMNKALKNLVEK